MLERLHKDRSWLTRACGWDTPSPVTKTRAWYGHGAASGLSRPSSPMSTAAALRAGTTSALTTPRSVPGGSAEVKVSSLTCSSTGSTIAPAGSAISTTPVASEGLSAPFLHTTDVEHRLDGISSCAVARQQSLPPYWPRVSLEGSTQAITVSASLQSQQAMSSFLHPSCKAQDGRSVELKLGTTYVVPPPRGNYPACIYPSVHIRARTCSPTRDGHPQPAQPQVAKLVKASLQVPAVQRPLCQVPRLQARSLQVPTMPREPSESALRTQNRAQSSCPRDEIVAKPCLGAANLSHALPYTITIAKHSPCPPSSGGGQVGAAVKAVYGTPVCKGPAAEAFTSNQQKTEHGFHCAAVPDNGHHMGRLNSGGFNGEPEREPHYTAAPLGDDCRETRTLSRCSDHTDEPEASFENGSIFQDTVRATSNGKSDVSEYYKELAALREALSKAAQALEYSEENNALLRERELAAREAELDALENSEHQVNELAAVSTLLGDMGSKLQSLEESEQHAQERHAASEALTEQASLIRERELQMLERSAMTSGELQAELQALVSDMRVLRSCTGSHYQRNGAAADGGLPRRPSVGPEGRSSTPAVSSSRTQLRPAACQLLPSATAVVQASPRREPIVQPLKPSGVPVVLQGACAGQTLPFAAPSAPLSTVTFRRTVTGGSTLRPPGVSRQSSPSGLSVGRTSTPLVRRPSSVSQPSPFQPQPLSRSVSREPSHLAERRCQPRTSLRADEQPPPATPDTRDLHGGFEASPNYSPHERKIQFSGRRVTGGEYTWLQPPPLVQPGASQAAATAVVQPAAPYPRASAASPRPAQAPAPTFTRAFVYSAAAHGAVAPGHGGLRRQGSPTSSFSSF